MDDKTVHGHGIRLEHIEEQLRLIRETQRIMAEQVGQMREKLFNGYSERIEAIHRRVYSQEPLGKDAVRTMIDAAILGNQDRSSKWLRGHVTEVIATVIAAAAFAISLWSR